MEAVTVHAALYNTDISGDHDLAASFAKSAKLPSFK